MNVADLLQLIDPHGPVEHRADGWWAVWPGVDVRKMATVMLEHQVRLATLTGVPRSDGVLRVIYHWDVDSKLVNIETVAADGQIPSIADLLPAADWAEREICDYYGTDFTGRGVVQPLVLRDGDPRGLFQATSDVGHEDNPATAARAAVAEERHTRPSHASEGEI